MGFNMNKSTEEVMVKTFYREMRGFSSFFLHNNICIYVGFSYLSSLSLLENIMDNQ